VRSVRDIRDLFSGIQTFLPIPIGHKIDTHNWLWLSLEAPPFSFFPLHTISHHTIELCHSLHLYSFFNEDNNNNYDRSLISGWPEPKNLFFRHPACIVTARTSTSAIPEPAKQTWVQTARLSAGFICLKKHHSLSTYYSYSEKTLLSQRLRLLLQPSKHMIYQPLAIF
jgi:hypothetical protein